MSGFPRHLAGEPHREQWGRVLRWRKRTQDLMARPDAEANQAMDFCLAFFISAHHMRDWIVASKPALQSSVDRHVRSCHELQLARDLCNGTKHMKLTRPSVDGGFLTAREYVPAPLNAAPSGPGYRLMMLASGEKVDLLTLADACVDSWRGFLDDHGLAATAD